MQSGLLQTQLARLPFAGILPGLLLALGIAGAASYLSVLIGVDGLGFAKSPVSPILIAILLGLLIRNAIGLPGFCEPGVLFTLNRVLKLGVALLGIRLSLSTIGSIGFEALPIVIGCIATALIVVNLLSRALGLSATLGTLIAVGTSICGCTAVMTVAPAIRARQSEVCYAITCVALFGTLGMLAYPFLAETLFADRPVAAGIFLGTAIHDTAQVIGAGMLYEQYFASSESLDAATVTKLVRNLSMLIVIPLLTWLFARREQAQDDQPIQLNTLVPLFILAFVGMSVVRTVGDLGDAAFGFIPRLAWESGVAQVTTLSGVLLAVAMGAVGLSTRLDGLRSLGTRPLAVGLCSALLVGAVSLGLISLFANP